MRRSLSKQLREPELQVPDVFQLQHVRKCEHTARVVLEAECKQAQTSLPE